MVEQTVGAQASETTELKSLEPQSVSENKRLWQFFWRTWAIQASWNYEGQMNLGFLYSIAPTLDRMNRIPRFCSERKTLIIATPLFITLRSSLIALCLDLLRPWRKSMRAIRRTLTLKLSTA